MKLLLNGLLLLMLLLPPTHEALAQAPPIPSGTCTNTSDYDIQYPIDRPGLFATIKMEIDTTLRPIGALMFENIQNTTNVVGAIRAAATLYILIYGLAFTFGMVQITAFDLMIRLAKIGVVATLLSSNAWFLFSNIFGGGIDANGNQTGFFGGGVDDIINAVTNAAIGGMDTTGGPFGPMDYAIAMVISPKMAATMIAAFTTGPYGIGIGLVFLMSIGSFLKAMMNAMWVYVMALVMRTFLFALAPLFIPCILFNRTRSLFDGWLNQIINSCLQPIFLFSFFSFFAVLFQACLDQVFQTPVCWTPLADAVKGAPFEGLFWRFAIQDCSSGNWVPFDGSWDFNGPVNVPCGQPVNPLGIMLPLTLWIIADLAGRFNDTVVQIAKDISNASTDLRMGSERIGDWMSGGGAGSEASNPVAGGRASGGRGNTGGSVGRMLGDAASTADHATKAVKTASDLGQQIMGMTGIRPPKQ